MSGERGCCGPAKLGYWLVIIGAINWGLIGLGGFFGGNWNVVNMIFGSIAWLEWIIYILVGISGVMMLFGCKKCKVKSSGGMPSGNMSGGNQGGM
jgi:uncharacterized protein